MQRLPVLGSAAIEPPSRCRAPSARSVAAGHRNRAALDRRGAGPRLLLLLGLGNRRRQWLRSLAADRRGDPLEGAETVSAYERVAMRQRRRHAPRARRAPGG